MNLAETLQLLDKLNSVGAKHFKSQDFEVCIANQPASLQTTVTNQYQPIANPEPAPLPSHSAEETRKAQALIDLLKQKDEEILNHIFPEGA